MKAWLRGFYYSLPVQLLFLHFRKYQALLIFWFILFSTINGSFMKAYGADSLFLAPEYLGNVNMLSFSIVGIAIGMFIMSWHVTTFILFSRHFKFLAATSNPFLRYCINNSILPLIFLVFYFYNAWHFSHFKELISSTDFFFLLGVFLFGLFFIFLMLIGYLLDSPFFQLPAAASSTIFFAILIGVAGAFTYFLQSWSIPYLIGLILLLNLFYKLNWIDPRNKAYGLNYENKNERPVYSRESLVQLCNFKDEEADRQNMIAILDKWKKKQAKEKPLLLLITSSGGANRSAAFTMNE